MRRSMALVVLASATVLLAGEASAGTPANELQLAAGYAAKETCSCVFVEGQSDAYCTNYGSLPTGVQLKITIDHTANTVTGQYLTATRVATFTSGHGCVLAGL